MPGFRKSGHICRSGVASALLSSKNSPERRGVVSCASSAGVQCRSSLCWVRTPGNTICRETIQCVRFGCVLSEAFNSTNGGDVR